MPKEQTEKSRYKSPSTGEYCTCAQYLAELMCQRMCEKDNRGSLPYKFWNTKKWKGIYMAQLLKANELLREHNNEAVVKTLTSGFGLKVYSLRFPSLKNLIEKEEEKIKSQKIEAPKEDYNVNINSESMKPFGKKSKFQKLRELDGKKNKND
jgi:hypothetical protein